MGQPRRPWQGLPRGDFLRETAQVSRPTGTSRAPDKRLAVFQPIGHATFDCRDVIGPDTAALAKLFLRQQAVLPDGANRVLALINLFPGHRPEYLQGRWR